MADNKDLLAQIAQLAGAINKHNLTMAAASNGRGYSPTYTRGGYTGARGRGGSPFSVRGNGRGRGAVNGSVHRSLTLNNNNGNSVASGSPIPATPPATSRASTIGQTAPSSALINVPNNPSATPLPRMTSSWPAQTPTSRHLTLNVKAQTSADKSISSQSPPLSVPINTAVGPGSTISVDKTTGQQWIQSKGKNMSLMNAETYEKTMVAKQKAIQSIKKAKLKAKQARAKRLQELRKGIVTIGNTSYARSADGRKLVINKKQSGGIVIDGIEFEMDPRGNKLVRKGLPSNGHNATSNSVAPSTFSTGSNNGIMRSALPTTTPKALSVDGVKYVRTTSGNLVRASLVRNQLLKKHARQKALAEKRRLAIEKKKAAREKMKSTFCTYFTRFGRCPKGHHCPFMHSRNHLAICKKFLRGQCKHTAATCRLSHTPSPHTVPPCVHFQRAACTNDNCLYPHIRINPKAPLCVPFTKEGWCDKGGECKDRHAWICPDFNTPQGCHRRCGLAHVPGQGSRDQQQNQQAPLHQRRARYLDGNGSNPEAQQDQDVASTPKSDGVRQYDENFIPFDLNSDDESEIVLQQSVPEHDRTQNLSRETQSQGESDNTEEEDEESEKSDNVEEMDVESDGMVSGDDSGDDIEEEEEEMEDDDDQGPGRQGIGLQPYDGADDNDNDEDEDDYMAYYQDEDEDDRGEY